MYHPSPYVPGAAPKKKRGWLVVLLVCGAGGLMVCGGCAGLFLLAGANAGATAARPEDRAIVLTIEDLSPYVEGFAPTASIARFERNDTWGAMEIDYEYDGSMALPAVYLSSLATLESSVDEAQGAYIGQGVGLSIGLVAVEGVTRQSRDDLFRWGDESRCELLIGIDGRPVGNSFSMRRGRTTFNVIFTGVYFDDPAALEELLRPKLEALAARGR